MSKFQLTLAIVKPDISRIPYVVDSIRSAILENEFLIPCTRIFRMDRKTASAFYQEHEGKFFYHRLITFMSSGTSHVHILAGMDAISKWRKLMGPTKVFKTRYEYPDTIRGQFGLTDTRNCTHGSDSEVTARSEISFFFPEFDYDAFRSDHGQFTKSSNLLRFDSDKFIHY